MDIDSHSKEQVFLYIVPKLVSYDMILGMPWVRKQDIQINGPRSEGMIMSTGTIVWNVVKPRKARSEGAAVAVSVLSFGYLMQGKCYTKVEVFAASMADINKALMNKVKTDPCTKLLEHFHEFLEMFSREKAVELPLYCGVGVDHEIQLESVDRREPKVL
jgi:hypothetical protein